MEGTKDVEMLAKNDWQKNQLLIKVAIITSCATPRHSLPRYLHPVMAIAGYFHERNLKAYDTSSSS